VFYLAALVFLVVVGVIGVVGVNKTPQGSRLHHPTLPVAVLGLAEPFDHSSPVNHGGAQILLHEWPHECVWAQLQYERWQQDRNPDYPNTTYLANLANEWARRGT
jgi:hypothetical protein